MGSGFVLLSMGSSFLLTLRSGCILNMVGVVQLRVEFWMIWKTQVWLVQKLHPQTSNSLPSLLSLRTPSARWSNKNWGKCCSVAQFLFLCEMQLFYISCTRYEGTTVIWLVLPQPTCALTFIPYVIIQCCTFVSRISGIMEWCVTGRTQRCVPPCKVDGVECCPTGTLCRCKSNLRAVSNGGVTLVTKIWRTLFVRFCNFTERSAYSVSTVRWIPCSSRTPHRC